MQKNFSTIAQNLGGDSSSEEDESDDDEDDSKKKEPELSRREQRQRQAAETKAKTADLEEKALVDFEEEAKGDKGSRCQEKE